MRSSNNIPSKRQAGSSLGKSKGLNGVLQTRGKEVDEVKSQKGGAKAKPIMISADSSELSEPPPESLAVCASADVMPETANPILGKEQLSSCGSASTNSSPAGFLLTKQAEHNDCILHAVKERKTASARFPTEQNKHKNGIPHSCLKPKVHPSPLQMEIKFLVCESTG